MKSALHNKRGELAKEIRKLADRQDQWTAEDRANWQTLNADYDVIMGRITADDDGGDTGIRRLLGRDGGTIGNSDRPRLNLFAGTERQVEQVGLALGGWLRASTGEHPVTEAQFEAAAELGVDVRNDKITLPLLNTGAMTDVRRSISVTGRPQAMGPIAFQNTLATETGGSGGFTVAGDFVRSLEVAMLSYGGMFQTAEIIRTATGADLPWPTADDTSNTGEQVGENSDNDGSTDPTFEAQIWRAYKFSSKMIKAPYELLEDSAFNLAQILGGMLGTRIGRIQNTRYTTGTGAAQPYGIVTRAATGKTTASSTAIAADEVIDLIHSVDPSIRSMPGVGLMFHDNILAALRKLKDGQGQYLWQSGFARGAPDSLLGYRYTINQDMASSIASGAKTILFGNLAAYKIRQVNRLRLIRLNERYAEKDQVAFIAFMRGDGDLLNAGDNPVKAMVQV